MAKVHFTKYIPDDETALDRVGDALYGTKLKSTGFQLHQENGDPEFITIEGHGLKYKNGYLTDGTITDLEIKDAMGRDLFTVHKASLEVEGTVDLATTYAYLFFTAVLGKNDIVIGSAENDILFGGEGRDHLNGLNGDDILAGEQGDTLTGKLGSDTFVFYNLVKNVIITDFDAVGGGSNQDYLWNADVEPGIPRIYADHGDTVLDYGGGHTLTLLDVKRSDVSIDDFKKPDYLDDM